MENMIYNRNYTFTDRYIYTTNKFLHSAGKKYEMKITENASTQYKYKKNSLILS